VEIAGLTEIAAAAAAAAGARWISKYTSEQDELWEHHVEQILGALLFSQIVGGPFLDQTFQVASVLLHPRQQVVQ